MGSDRRNPGRRGDRGSSMVYVILFVTLLAIFSCGYMAISRFNMKSTLNSRSYMEAQLMAKTIHRTFSESVGREGSAVMDSIWQCFEADCETAYKEYNIMIGLEAGKGGNREKEYDDNTPEANGNERWKRYLTHTLGDKEYVMKGSGSVPGKDGVTVDITVRAKPLHHYANVCTKVVCNGYTFSMKADIVFDNSDDALMAGSSRYRRSGVGGEIYLDGNGVYRYYEGGEE